MGRGHLVIAFFLALVATENKDLQKLFRLVKVWNGSSQGVVEAISERL